MIRTLRLRNFKGIRRAEVGLERLTVIVGPNASGKTSFLEGLHHLILMSEIPPSPYFQGHRDPLQLYRRDAPGDEMELTCWGGDGGLRLRIIPPTNLPRNGYYTTTAQGEWQFQVEGMEADDDLGDWRPVGKTPELARSFGPAELLRLDASRMAQPSRHARTRMGSDGRGLASALALIALNRPDDFASIQARLKAIVPLIERIRFDRRTVILDQHGRQRVGLDPRGRVDEGEQESFEEYLVFDTIGAPDIFAHQMSEGTLLALGLLTYLMGRDRPNLILLDDLDHGLHPKAQRELVGLLRTILDQDPDLQIVATTHSPYLVDCLRPEEVRLTTLGEDGTVSIAGLVDHPDFDKWKDEMAPGEMWSLFGEKWVGEVNKVAGVE